MPGPPGRLRGVQHLLRQGAVREDRRPRARRQHRYVASQLPNPIPIPHHASCTAPAPSPLIYLCTKLTVFFFHRRLHRVHPQGRREPALQVEEEEHRRLHLHRRCFPRRRRRRRRYFHLGLTFSVQEGSAQDAQDAQDPEGQEGCGQESCFFRGRGGAGGAVSYQGPEARR